MSHKKLIANGTVVALGDANQVIEDGAVLIDGNIIEKVGPRSMFAGDKAELIDAHGGVIMPGFINAHMHYYSTFACGMGIPGEPASNFKETLERLWWRLDKALTLDDVEYSALVMMCRALRAGVTTVVDHHASPNAVEGSLARIADAASLAGIRSCLCYELSDRDGAEIARQGIEENIDFIKHCRDARDPMLSALFGMHASMTIGAETMEAAVAATAGLEAGFHIHTSESLFDPEDSLAKYGKRVVERLADAGVLGEKTICVHCIHLDPREAELLRETNTIVVHNPQSNMNNAVGAADVIGMLKSGILVGLGSDGMTANILDELRTANIIHKHVAKDPRVGFMEAATMLLSNNAKIATRLFGRPVGVLAPGQLADVITLDYAPPTPLRNETWLGHAIFGLYSARVRTTVVNGEIRMADGKLLGIDECEIAGKSRELAEAMWKRL